jgi:hypothetical protein
MGYGGYSHEAHVAFTDARSGLARESVFTQRSCHPLMNPKGLRARECRDSADHPRSLAVAFALDVTGSMGGIPDLLARQELPKFMAALTAFGVTDPQLLFMAVGDATCDQSPLQVGQFEATAELMDQWLTWSHLEGGGGGQNTESYELAMYALAEHTALDCFEKRKKRGYAFFTGDELPYPAVSKRQVEALIGDQLDEDVPTEAVVAALQQTWHPFFLIPDPARAGRCGDRWRGLLGDHCVVMDGPLDTCAVAAALVAIGEGLVRGEADVAAGLERAGLERARVAGAMRALAPFIDGAGLAAPPPLARPPADAGGLVSWIKALLT